MEFRNLKEINKAYTEGIYADSPLNRKLGRVGMTYKAYADKINKEKSKDSSFKKDEGKNINKEVSNKFNSNDKYGYYHGTKQEFEDLFKMIKGKEIDLNNLGTNCKIVGLKVRHDGYATVTVENNKGYHYEIPMKDILKYPPFGNGKKTEEDGVKAYDYFILSGGKIGLNIDPKVITNN